MVRALISVQLNVIRSITPSKVVEDASLGHTAVAVVGLVVHDELVVDKVETVGSGRERLVDHLLDHILVQLGKVVNVLAGVFAIWHAESEIEIERFQVLVPEK